MCGSTAAPLLNCGDTPIPLLAIRLPRKTVVSSFVFRVIQINGAPDRIKL
jgi:hypothetical protein